MKYSVDTLFYIFRKGLPVKNKDSDLYRLDKFGNLIYWHSYGKLTPMGWEVDHSKPKAAGGTDHLNNLQPLHWQANRNKGAKY